MTAYNNAYPPYSLYPGDIGYSFQTEAVPAVPTAGQAFAIAQMRGTGEGIAIRWQTLFATAPGAIGISLQGAMADVDAEYKDLDTSTSTAGESKTVTAVKANFIRAKVTSSTVTNGAGMSIKFLV